MLHDSRAGAVLGWQDDLATATSTSTRKSCHDD